MTVHTRCDDESGVVTVDECRDEGDEDPSR